ncbi:GDSL-like Lipase/Acylhydrolase superfamily protein [Actinidia rufa]|uniref:GDSL-like Lipase/Acylhydrolase superfamily protein n=1 Tax=Actinidia rufa TaxID=165716 RepID=A0A7J0F8B3_9ERIC|nr:GDSL-like Lipase/Acylhydrolase superfamily protein [Actinidia rufa]
MAGKLKAFILLLTLPTLSFTNSFPVQYPAVFNFGDSNSETGEFVAGRGVLIGLPYGRAYNFGKLAGRISDGRLIVDFLMDAMGLPFLNPYLNAIGAPSFKNGCNFAAAGCTVLPATGSSICPYSLRIQVAQFLRFKALVLELQSESKELDRHLPSEDYFGKGLYMFDIGQNDLGGDFDSMSSHQVLDMIQTILTEFKAGVEVLYEEGARNFWVHNMRAVGCMAQTIFTFGTDKSRFDELGCLISHNQAAKLFNQQLHELWRKLKSQYSDANVTYTDIFTIHLDLIANHTRYGFKQPIMACCGYGAPPLNYDSRISCGQTQVLDGRSVTAEACKDGAEYVSWDGTHLTDAANQYISSEILTRKHFDPLFSDKTPFLLKSE